MEVFLIHSSIFITYPWILKRFISYGQDGLLIYFILTGYLAFGSYHRSKNIKSYYKKRLIKIVPVYYFWLLILMGLYYVGILATEAGNALKNPITLMDWLRSFVIVNNVIPSSNWIGMWALGSLSCFILFYILIPVIARFITSFERSVFLLVGLIIFRLVFTQSLIKAFFQIFTFDFNQETMMSVFPLWHIYLLGIGICIYWGIKSERKNQLLLYFMLLFLLDYRYNLEISQGITIGIIVAIILCYPIHLKGFDQVICKASKYTYALYIVHFSCFDILWNIGRIYYPDSNLIKVLLIVVPVLLSVIIYHLFEEPVTKWLKKKFLSES